MRLATFISNNKSLILSAWSAFFEANYPDVRTKGVELQQNSQREAILEFIVRDIGLGQTASQRRAKSKGKNRIQNNTSAGRIHGMNRIKSGLGITGILAEYRALRASVIDLWMSTTPNLNKAEVRDLIRFGEAIDQALTDSVKSYAIGREKPSQQVELIMASVSDQAYLIDLDFKITYANQAVTQLYNRPLERIVGMNFCDLCQDVTLDKQQIVQQLVDTKLHFCEDILQQGNGHETVYEYIYVPIVNELDELTAIAVTARDVTKRKQIEDESWHNANYDTLTSLPNRRMFLNKLAEDIKWYKRHTLTLALLFIDLDSFKAVNDDFGHRYGDMLLKQVAVRIALCVRDTDTVARLGGDEFTVILREVDKISSVEWIAAKILQQLNRPFEIMGNELHISGSIGITLFPEDAHSVDELLEKADKAMYQAKKAGRNQFKRFSPH